MKRIASILLASLLLLAVLPLSVFAEGDHSVNVPETLRPYLTDGLTEASYEEGQEVAFTVFVPFYKQLRDGTPAAHKDGDPSTVVTVTPDADNTAFVKTFRFTMPAYDVDIAFAEDNVAAAPLSRDTKVKLDRLTAQLPDAGEALTIIGHYFDPIILAVSDDFPAFIEELEKILLELEELADDEPFLMTSLAEEKNEVSAKEVEASAGMLVTLWENGIADSVSADDLLASLPALFPWMTNVISLAENGSAEAQGILKELPTFAFTFACLSYMNAEELFISGYAPEIVPLDIPADSDDIIDRVFDSEVFEKAWLQTFESFDYDEKTIILKAAELLPGVVAEIRSIFELPDTKAENATLDSLFGFFAPTFDRLADEAKSLRAGVTPLPDDTYRNFKNILVWISEEAGLEGKDQADFIGALDEWIDHPEISSEYDGFVQDTIAPFVNVTEKIFDFIEKISERGFSIFDLDTASEIAGDLLDVMDGFLADRSEYTLLGEAACFALTVVANEMSDYDFSGLAQNIVDSDGPRIVSEVITTGVFLNITTEGLEMIPDLLNLILDAADLIENEDYISLIGAISNIISTAKEIKEKLNVKTVEKEIDRITEKIAGGELEKFISLDKSVSDSLDLHFEKVLDELRIFRALDGAYTAELDKTLDALDAAKTAAEARTIADELLKNCVCVSTKKAGLSEGKLDLYLNDSDVGEFTFAQSNGGWTISDGALFLAEKNGELVKQESPFVWYYENGSFSTVKTSSQIRLPLLRGFNKVSSTANAKTYFLSTVRQGADLSRMPVKTAFYQKTVAGKHTFVFTDLKNGYHAVACSVCGKKLVDSEKCSYDKATDKCTCCGSYILQVTVDWKKTVDDYILFVIYHCKATIHVSSSELTVSKTEYSLDNGKTWKAGSGFESDKNITTFQIRITDSNGKQHLFDCKNGEVTLKTVANASAKKTSGRLTPVSGSKKPVALILFPFFA